MAEFNLDRITDSVLEEVVGQEYAITLIHNTLATNFLKRIKTGYIKGVLASFMLVGHTGVGKTETVKQYARELNKFGWNFIRLDMSEFSDYHTVSALVGAPKGYVGSDECGRLTGHLRSFPRSVILIDELEKGHQKVYDILLQMLDEARLTDMSFGFTVSFPWSIVFITSNLASYEISRIIETSEDPQKSEIAIKKLLQTGIRPEILGRVDKIVPYANLTPEHYKEITRKVFKRYNIQYTEEEIENLYSRFSDSIDFGVREYVRQIENYLLSRRPD